MTGGFSVAEEAIEGKRRARFELTRGSQPIRKQNCLVIRFRKVLALPPEEEEAEVRLFFASTRSFGCSDIPNGELFRHRPHLLEVSAFLCQFGAEKWE